MEDSLTARQADVVRFVMINNYEINVLECTSRVNDCKLIKIDQNILQMFQSLDQRNFVVLKEDKQTVKLITSGFEIEYRTLYQELVGKIERILTSYTRTFMLIENAGEFTIKVFNFDAKADMKQKIFTLASKIVLDNLSQNDIIVSFLNSKEIIDDCLV